MLLVPPDIGVVRRLMPTDGTEADAPSKPGETPRPEPPRYPTCCPSGEKNGVIAGTGVASVVRLVDPMRRTISLPTGSTTTRVSPFGDRASDGLALKAASGSSVAGVAMSKLTTRGSSTAANGEKAAPTPSAAATSQPATARRVTHERHRRPDADIDARRVRRRCRQQVTRIADVPQTLAWLAGRDSVRSGGARPG